MAEMQGLQGWTDGRRVAEWLAHSTAKQKVAGSTPTRASGWKTPSVHPEVKWVPDLIQGRKGSGRRLCCALDTVNL